MVDENMLNNAFEMSKEEILDPENITKEDIRNFTLRMDDLLSKLKEECDE